jgi:hypothetical protein
MSPSKYLPNSDEQCKFDLQTMIYLVSAKFPLSFVEHDSFKRYIILALHFWEWLEDCQ